MSCAEFKAVEHVFGGEPGPRRDGGFILVAVLSALAVLSTLAASFVVATRIHARAAANVVLASRLEAAADAGVTSGVLSLLAREELFAHPDRRLACAFDDQIVIETSVEDEAGKVDLNFADERLLAQLLLYAGVAETEVAAHIDRIVDFRDKDDLKRPNGAESGEYREAGVGYGPGNGEFATVEELDQVLHLPEAVVAAIRPHVTVHSKQVGLDVDAASLSLVAALSEGARQVTQSHEAAPLPKQLTLGKYPFPHELRARSSRTTFTVTSIASTVTGGRFVRRAIIEIASAVTAQYQILDWRRAQSSPDAAYKPAERCW